MRDKIKESKVRLLDDLLKVATANHPMWRRISSVAGILVCGCENRDHGVALAMTETSVRHLVSMRCYRCRQKPHLAAYQDILHASLILGGWNAMQEAAQNLFDSIEL